MSKKSSFELFMAQVHTESIFLFFLMNLSNYTPSYTQLNDIFISCNKKILNSPRHVLSKYLKTEY